MAQGACMALEDAVTLGEALRVNNNDWPKALDLYQRSRVARTARIVLSGREMGRLYHAKGCGAAGAQQPVEGPHTRAVL
jgi:2-polyprenyl-6-methoxyphenol hydroxylase-like FAD-dependent oxidoreductase